MKRRTKMGIDPVTHKKSRSYAPRTGGAGPVDGAARAQHGEAHTAQWESVRLWTETRASEARRLRAHAASASASVTAPPQMPGPAAAHRLNLPTSTLSFSDADVAAARAAKQPVQAQDEARKDHRLQQQWGDHVIDVADADNAAAAFADMLLDDSLIEQQTENEKKYWESIMNLVNSSSASLQTSVAMPALQASSSSASLQTSVTMPALQAYSSSASLSDCVRAREAYAYSSSAAFSTSVADSARAREAYAYSSSAAFSTSVADGARARDLATLMRWTPDQ